MFTGEKPHTNNNPTLNFPVFMAQDLERYSKSKSALKVLYTMYIRKVYV